MDYHRMAELHHTARANAYAFGPRAKVLGHRVRAAMHARRSRMRFGALAKGSEAANAEALGTSLSCPITLALFVDPVVASTGQTYERSALERRLRDSDKCPVTGVPITRTLVANWLVRSMVAGFIETYGAREGDEWEGIRRLCHPEPEASAADDTAESAQVKRYVQMPYEELDTDDAGAYREKVRRYLLYGWTMDELDDCYTDHENDGFQQGSVQDETAVEVANDTVSTGTLLGFIRTREDAQLRRFGAEHLTAFARHDAAATAADVPFKHLFGLHITRSVEEYEDARLDGDAAAQAFWDGD